MTSSDASLGVTKRDNGRCNALLSAARGTAGFLRDDEGLALVRAAERAAQSHLGPLMEIGAYLGRSTLYLATGVVAAGVDEAVLYSLDHHHGSEEMQPGWADHDPTLIDPRTGRMDSLPRWRMRIEQAGAEDFVVGIVGASALVASNWLTPLSLVFIDGGHSSEIAWSDYEQWSSRVSAGGQLIFHDVFPNPKDGGRPPYECFSHARSSGRFVEAEHEAVGSLRFLIAQ